MIEEEFPVDLLLRAEPVVHRSWQSWLLLVLMLAIAAWTLWSEYQRERDDRAE